MPEVQLVGGDRAPPAARTLGARGDEMSVATVLSRLDAVRRTGEARWIARCPSHPDRSPSLSIRELSDGRLLLHDFGGCQVESVLIALGLDFDALFPEKPIEHAPRERRAFFPSDVFQIVRREIGVAAIIAADMHKGREISEADYARLFVCVERLNDVGMTAYGK